MVRMVKVLLEIVHITMTWQSLPHPIDKMKLNAKCADTLIKEYDRFHLCI
jgi:hypothetical protein